MAKRKRVSSKTSLAKAKKEVPRIFSLGKKAHKTLAVKG